jgi:hypothetical protein
VAASKATDMSFRELQKLLKESGDSQLLELVDSLASAILLISPIATPGTPGWALIGPKNTLVGLGKKALARLTSRKGETFLDKHTRMAVAHCLVCYTAFFEAVANITPTVRDDLELTSSEKLVIASEAAGRASVEDEEADTSTIAHEIPLPHPVEGREHLKADLRPLYEEMTRGFRRWLAGMAAWEHASEEVRGRVEAELSRLPDLALESYEALYFALAEKFSSFLVWTDLRHREEVGARLVELNSATRAQIELARSSVEQIDVGFARLEAALGAVDARVRADKAAKVLTALGAAYREYLDEPVFDVRSDEPEGLTFPAKRDIFVPQAFRVRRVQTHTERLEDEVAWHTERLEDEMAWERLDVQEGVGGFIVNYLRSPYSIETPLIVLGHPGSGKSLLTEMLAARIATPEFQPIRVQLRDVHAEEPQGQIEEQIRRETTLPIDWAELSDELKDAPPVVILDGYDELLQTRGAAFADYLERVRRFQRAAARNQRPVRVIVTSRITLIDRAEVPEGSTVIRLEDFDEQRRTEWTRIWNSHNRGHFHRAGIREFTLPEVPSVVALAQQPLLLLMLAIFDSKANELHRDEKLDQTLLYDKLLRRFIARERGKRQDEPFRSLPPHTQKERIDEDLDLLGIAALGMFNRGAHHILSEQLADDISYSDPRVVEDLAPASADPESLLRGFFFVHESRTRATGAGSAQRDSEMRGAYEFLHRTFWEFLTADQILRRIHRHVGSVCRALDQRDRALVHAALNGPGREAEDWLLPLIFRPLFSEPLIVQMLRQWHPHKLELGKHDPDAFGCALEEVLTDQLRRILGTGSPAPILTGTSGRRVPHAALPLVGHLATYSVNLIVLWAMLSKTAPILQEEVLPRADGGTRPWDRLTHLWRSWFEFDRLSQLAAIVDAERESDSITITPKDFVATQASGSDRLNTVLTVAETIADDMLSGLAALHAYDSRVNIDVDLEVAARRLRAEDIDASAEIALRRIKAERDLDDNAKDVVRRAVRGRSVTPTIRELLECARDPDAPAALVQAVHSGTLDKGPLVRRFFPLGDAQMHIAEALEYHEPGEETVEVRLNRAPVLLLGSRHGFPHLRAAVELSAGDPRVALSVRGWEAATAEALVAAAEYAEHIGQPDGVKASLSRLLDRGDSDELAALSPEALRALIALSEAHGLWRDLVRRLVGKEASGLGGRLGRLPLDALVNLVRLAPTPPHASRLEELLALAARQSRLLRGEPLARYALAVLRLSGARSADKPRTRLRVLTATRHEESIMDLLALTPRRLASMPEAPRKDVEALIHEASLQGNAPT